MPNPDPTGSPRTPASQTPQATYQPPIPPQEVFRLANFLRSAAQNPETRAQVAEIARKIDPGGIGRAFSDIELNNRFEQLEKKIAEKDLEKQVKDAVDAQAREKEALTRTGKYTDDQIKDIEATMRAKNVYSYHDGAILYDAEHPPAPPDPVTGQSAMWEFPTVTKRDGSGMVPLKDFQKDTKQAAYDAAFRVIDEFKFNKLPSAFRTA